LLQIHEPKLTNPGVTPDLPAQQEIFPPLYALHST